MSSYRRPESVLVVVYTAEQQCLMLQRRQPAGFWQSVTGGLEAGESAEACAQRELLEETGIDTQPLNSGIVNRFEILPQWRHRYDPQHKTNTEYVFSLRLPEKMTPCLDPQEHVSYAWLDAAQAIKRCFSHTNAEAIQRIVLAENK
jgi:dATP pyrophosphohydrolase